MGWRVKWTRLAWADVEESVRFIHRDSPRYAIVLQREAQAAAQSLKQFALRTALRRKTRSGSSRSCMERAISTRF